MSQQDPQQIQLRPGETLEETLFIISGRVVTCREVMDKDGEMVLDLGLMPTGQNHPDAIKSAEAKVAEAQKALEDIKNAPEYVPKPSE